MDADALPCGSVGGCEYLGRPSRYGDEWYGPLRTAVNSAEGA